MIFTSQKCILRVAQRAATLVKQVMSRTCAVRYSVLSGWVDYFIFLPKVLRWRASRARAQLKGVLFQQDKKEATHRPMEI